MAINTKRINDLPDASNVNTTDIVHIVQGTNDVKATVAQLTPLMKGDTGDPGGPGSAATIEVGTVTTGAAGSSVAITNAGTTAAAKFNFTIPRGDKGDQGDAVALSQNITTTASAQGAINPTATAYQGSGTILTQTAGLQAGTRTLEELLGSLVNLSHSHSTKTFGAANCSTATNCNCYTNCNCNCGSS